MIARLLASLARDDAVVGPAAFKVRREARKLLYDWSRRYIAIPSGKSIAHMDQKLVRELRRRKSPGLVLFSSGSTGEPKAALHDVTLLLKKFYVKKPAKRMIFFLLFDHIGGINTLLHSLSSEGTLIAVSERTPEAIVDAIEKHKAQVLPTTPTFLNLLLLSGAWQGRDLSSLELITYGTEPMPESTLAMAVKAFPGVRFQQTYGLSELGILRSKSRGNDSLWVKVGGDGYETRVVDGLLEIKAESAMLGYLNAPSPFTPDGWFKTGDVVEVDGEWLRILGRRSEIINVGGEKVYPAEVESLVQALPGVVSAVVSGEPHPLTGNLVKVRVQLSTDENAATFRKRLWGAWKAPRYMMPIKVDLATEPLHNERFKKARCSAS